MTALSDPLAASSEDTSGATLQLTGREVAKEIRQQCAAEVEALKSRYSILPGLAVVRVGQDPASVNYAERIIKGFGNAGLSVTEIALPERASRALVQAEISRLNVLHEIAGIIVQMPLPDRMGLDTVIDVLDPQKDVDGIHPVNIGRLTLGLDCYVPATPAGGMAILDYYDIPLEGKNVLVIGRSGVVGRPLSQLMLARNATVTIAHSRSRNLPELIAAAEVVATAVGKPGFVRGANLGVGAVVLDFGAAEVDGKMTGDVDPEGATGRVAAITPVPGGTGPVTNAMLLKNTIKAIKKALG
jgi:methylenetetrahydrofolate dehydrogenase (NADP+) / methenyltetrahydrofolate cyclohydrolase